MKKIYSVLSSIALLFSLPALAAPLAEKAIETKSSEKESREKTVKETVIVEKGPKAEASSPICRGGGG